LFESSSVSSRKSKKYSQHQLGLNIYKKELSQAVTFRVSQLSAKLNSQATRLLRKHAGLSLVQWRILFLLDMFDTAYAAELSQLTGMDAGLFSRNLRNLVEVGYVATTSEPTDQRQACLRLTSAGKKAFEAAAPFMMQRRDALLEGISKTDKKVFYKVLDQIEQNASRLDNEEK